MKKALLLSGIYWDETWQRHQQFAEYLVSMGYKVYFVEHIVSSVLTVKKVKEMLIGAETVNLSSNNPRSENIVLCSIKSLPPQKRLFYIWNKNQVKKLIKEIGNQFDVVFNYLPINTTRYFLERIEYKTLIYDCVRNFTGWTGCQYPKDIGNEEEVLSNCADMVFTDSFYLTDKFRSMGCKDKVVQFFPVIDRKWQQGVANKPVSKQIVKVAYFGTFSTIHNDVEVYKALADAGFEIHFWGSVPLNLEFSYVDHGFKNNLAELSREITEKCDAIVIAYRGNMDGVIPAKLFQAIGSNLPVFISRFYDAEKLSEYMYVFSDKNDLIDQMRKFSPEDYSLKKEKNVKFLEDKGGETQYEQFKSVISQKQQN